MVFTFFGLQPGIPFGRPQTALAQVFGTWLGWSLLSYYAMFHFVSWSRSPVGWNGMRMWNAANLCSDREDGIIIGYVYKYIYIYTHNITYQILYNQQNKDAGIFWTFHRFCAINRNIECSWYKPGKVTSEGAELTMTHEGSVLGDTFGWNCAKKCQLLENLMSLGIDLCTLALFRWMFDHLCILQSSLTLVSEANVQATCPTIIKHLW